MSTVNHFHTDTLHIISSFLPSRSLFPLRLVSKNWNQLLISNNTWKILFERDFGNLNWFIEKWNNNLKNNEMYESEEESVKKNYKSNKKIENKKTENIEITLQHLEKECNENLYFLLYLSVILSTPLQKTNFEEEKKDKKRKKAFKKFYEKDKYYEDDEKEDDEEEEDESWEDKEVFELFYYFNLRLQTLFEQFEKRIKNQELLKSLKEAIICDINTHRLGIVFSIFDKNGLKLRLLGNETTFTVKDLPKQEKSNKKQKKISLDKEHMDEAEKRKDVQLECAYVMIGYPDDFDIIPLSKFSYAMICGREDTLFPRMKEGKNGKQTIAVSPYIKGRFTPFCYYLNEEFIMNDVPNDDIFDLEDCDNFCPGFWNASFYWHYSVTFGSVYKRKIEMLKVSQAQHAKMG